MTKLYDTKFIGSNMHYLRKSVLNLSQEAFSEKVCLSKDTISNIERGRYLPNVSTLVNVSNATMIPVEFFLKEIEG